MIRATLKILVAAAAFGAIGTTAIAGAPASTSLSPKEVLDSAPQAVWKDVPAEDIVVMTLADGAVFAYQLSPFAPVHATNIRQLVRSGYFNGASILRVQDDYVVQWGRPDEDTTPAKDINEHPPAEYEFNGTGMTYTRLPWRDAYADSTGFIQSWPVAADGNKRWLVHCYGMIGVARDVPPDTGSGTQLYTIIGHAPRHLDRNLTVAGRMLSGMDILSDRPRGTEDLGFYKDDSQRMRIVSAMIAADMPAGTRPAYQVVDSTSATFTTWLHAKANRSGGFFVRAAGALDLCNALPPVRPHP